MSGRVHAICVTPAQGGATTGVGETRAVAGVGLQGDYRFDLAEHPPDTQLTLIEREAVEAANAEHGLALGPGDTRRNVVTEGVRLNDLVGREFTIGEVRARGIELCEPCAHLQRLTGQPMLKALLHRGGLCAEILESGTIRVGAAVRPAPATRSRVWRVPRTGDSATVGNRVRSALGRHTTDGEWATPNRRVRRGHGVRSRTRVRSTRWLGCPGTVAEGRRWGRLPATPEGEVDP